MGLRCLAIGSIRTLPSCRPYLLTCILPNGAIARTVQVTCGKSFQNNLQIACCPGYLRRLHPCHRAKVIPLVCRHWKIVGTQHPADHGAIPLHDPWPLKHPSFLNWFRRHASTCSAITVGEVGRKVDSDMYASLEILRCTVGPVTFVSGNLNNNT